MRLQQGSFLSQIAEAYLEQRPSESGVSDPATIRRQIDNLKAKRDRVLEAFFDGAIDRGERDQRLGRVDAELKAYGDMMMLTTPATGPLSIDELAATLSVFTEMPFLERDDKRALLHGLGVKVSVSGYTIQTLAMRNVAGLDSYSDSRLKTAP